MKAGTNTCTTHNIDDDVKMKKKNKKEKKKKKQVNEEQSAVSNKMELLGPRPRVEYKPLPGLHPCPIK